LRVQHLGQAANSDLQKGCLANQVPPINLLIRKACTFQPKHTRVDWEDYLKTHFDTNESLSKPMIKNIDPVTRLVGA